MFGAWFLDGPLEGRELVVDSALDDLRFVSLHPDELQDARLGLRSDDEPLRTLTHVYTRAGAYAGGWWRGVDGLRWFLYEYQGVGESA